MMWGLIMRSRLGDADHHHGIKEEGATPNEFLNAAKLVLGVHLASVVQGIEQRSSKPWVAGSNPAGSAIIYFFS